MRWLRLYSPVVVVVLWALLGWGEVRCPIGFAVVLMLAVVVHARELAHGNHWHWQRGRYPR